MSASDIELELKLRLVTPGDWTKVFETAALAPHLTAPPQDEHLESWYFDTADGALRQAGLAYRIRLEGGRWLATVKADDTSAGGLHIRREWTVPVAEPDPAIAHFSDCEAGPLLAAAVDDDPLALQFSTIFDRRKVEVTVADGSRVEVAADRGLIVAGDREETFAEVELELKEGTAAAVLGLGAALAGELPLVVESRSKYLRALILAGLADAAAITATPDPDPASPAFSGVRTLIVSQIHQVLAAYETFCQDSEQAETLHDLRITLRRLRSLLSFAKPLTDPRDYASWREELRVLSRTMNSLRETDVIRATWQAMTDGLPALTPPPWLGLLLTTERSRQTGKLDAALVQGRLTAVMLALWAWVAAEDSLATGDLPLSSFAAMQIRDWLSGMRADGRDFTPDALAALHRLRIQAKKLRYVLDALPLKDRRTRQLALRLKKLQDSLGIIRDSQTMRAVMGDWMGRHASRVVHRDAGMLIGWTARMEAEAHDDFGRVWKRFKRAARRWEKVEK